MIVHVLLTKHFVRLLLVDQFSTRQLFVVIPVILACFNLVGIVFNAGQVKVFKVYVHATEYIGLIIAAPICLAATAHFPTKDAPRETI